MALFGNRRSTPASILGGAGGGMLDAEIAPLTQEQQNMLLNNQDYVNNYNALQSMVQAEVLNLVRGKIEASEFSHE